MVNILHNENSFNKLEITIETKINLKMPKMNNSGLNIMVKFATLLIALLILEIVILIKIFNLDSSLYIPFMLIINMGTVYFFWWKNKGIRNEENNET